MPSIRRPLVNPRFASELKRNAGALMKKTGFQGEMQQRMAMLSPGERAEIAYREHILGEREFEHRLQSAEARAEQLKEGRKYMKMRQEAAQKYDLLIKEVQNMLAANRKFRGFLPNTIGVDIVIALRQHMEEHEIRQMMLNKQLFNHVIQSSGGRVAMTLARNRRFYVLSKKNPILLYGEVEEAIEESLRETGMIKGK
jgi:hypothetical protein